MVGAEGTRHPLRLKQKTTANDRPALTSAQNAAGADRPRLASRFTGPAPVKRVAFYRSNGAFLTPSSAILKHRE